VSEFSQPSSTWLALTEICLHRAWSCVKHLRVVVTRGAGRWTNRDAAGRRRPLHRALAQEGPQAPAALLAQHGVPLLVMHAEVELGCVKSVYWDEGVLPPARAAQVSPLLACIGSPCLRNCLHGASIGWRHRRGGAPTPQGAVRAHAQGLRGARRPRSRVVPALLRHASVGRPSGWTEIHLRFGC
jgi:hypothetical protein